MVSVAGKDIVYRFFDLINAGHDAAAAALVTADYINHEAPDHGGIEGAGATIASLRSCFSDMHYMIMEVVAEGDHAWAHVVMSGRFTGGLYGVRPTGQPFAQHQIHMFRLAGGKMAEHRAVRDDLGMLIQVGAIAPLAGNDGAKASPAQTIRT